MRTSHFNTTHEVHPALGRYEKKAVTQQDRILEWFKMYEQQASPSKVLRVVFPGEHIPITSIRRAMTNLTDAGELVKTDRQVKGEYGRNEYVWTLDEKYKQRRLF